MRNSSAKSAQKDILWGGDIEIAKLIKMLQDYDVELKIVDENNNLLPVSSGQKAGKNGCITLIYNGYHYDFIHPLTRKTVNVKQDGDCLFRAIVEACKCDLKYKDF